MGESDDENFATFGNPLEPLDEENLTRKKAITIEDQYAYDQQGRRRFHGAFTGGFSAGYFNTVGTRDGWKPQQFKSSRSSKAGNVAQRAQDFMDDEDTGEFGFAPTAIRSNSDYTTHSTSSKGVKRDRLRQAEDQIIPGVPVLNEILKPTKDTIGILLLKKMGWKPGQGVGPRLTKREKTVKAERNKGLKIYGCSLPSSSGVASSDNEEDDEDFDVEITFAPDDYEPFRCNPKDNYFGIGYSGLSQRPILLSSNNQETFRLQDNKKKLSIRGQAFGVGAFEADDEDIYAREDMSSYDFALGPPSKKKSRWVDPKKDTDSSCLEGFAKSTQPLSSVKNYPAPTLPKDFKAMHITKKSRFYPPIEPSTSKAKSQPTRHDRARILSETTSNIEVTSNKQQNEQSQVEAPKNPSWMDKLQLQSFVSAGREGTSKNASGALKTLSELKETLKPSVEPDSRLACDKPFIADLDKQRRYEQFLVFVNDNEKHKLSTIQPLSMTEWDRDRELEEFEQTYRLFKPPQVTIAKIVETNDHAEDKSQPKILTFEDQMKHAAKMKMFGKLTRERTTWRPVSIVYKRFNIPEPKGDYAMPEQKKSEKFSIFSNMGWDTDKQFEKSETVDPNIAIAEERAYKVSKVQDEPVEAAEEPSASPTPQQDSFGSPRGETNVSTVEINDSNNEDIAESQLDKKDLFKSIFLSSSEESEGEDNNEKIDGEIVKAVLIGEEKVTKAHPRNVSPPKGIFANLDLDNLVAPRAPKVPDSSQKSNESEKASEPLRDDATELPVEDTATTSALPPDAYGPVLPSQPSASSAQSSNDKFEWQHKKLSSQKLMEKLGSWVEKSKSKKSKKDKKKHKHKEKYKDSRDKKSKKHKR